MKISWFNIITLAALVIMSIVIWRGCSNSGAKDQVLESTARVNDSLKWDADRRDSADHVRDLIVATHDSVFQNQIDSLQRIISGQKDSLKSAKKALQIAVRDLGDQIAGMNDTALSRKYDSVTAELDRAYDLVADYSNSNDTTISLMGRQLDYKDSVISVLRVEVSDLKKALTACTLNFDGLKTETDKAEKKLKVRGFLSKMGATVAAVLAAILILKK